MLFTKVMIAYCDDKLEASIVNASRQYKIIIYYQIFKHKNDFLSNNVDLLACPMVSCQNSILLFGFENIS